MKARFSLKLKLGKPIKPISANLASYISFYKYLFIYLYQKSLNESKADYQKELVY